MDRSPRRFLIYSHDTYGLGHFRRCSLLAQGIVQSSVDAEVLIVTGSPRAQAFALPDRVDSLKLPAATKDNRGSYQPRKIMSDLDSLVRLRSGILFSAASNFDPDVIVVDHAPIGMAGELLPVLRCLDHRARRPRLVLGMREIVDDAKRVDDEWRASGVWEWIERYDDILVYGDASIETTASELRLDDRVRATVTHTGFVAPRMPEALPVIDPFLLVTPGGGGDGHALVRGVLDAAEGGTLVDFRIKIVTGPLMSPRRQAELNARAERSPSIEIVTFADNMRQLVASASGVISMAGYNTVVEELAADVPALLVPRTTPRVEQDVRARRLSPMTRLERCPLGRLTPDRLADFARRCGTGIGSSAAGVRRLDLNGVATAASILTTGHVHAKEPCSV